MVKDEEIKEGDWFYHLISEILKCTKIESNFTKYKKFTVPKISKVAHSSNIHINLHPKKIIATTNKALTYKISIDYGSSIGNTLHTKNLPRPSDDFLKAFVKAQGKITEVLVEYEEYCKDISCGKNSCYLTGKCENLSMKLKVAKDNTITIKSIQKKKTS